MRIWKWELVTTDRQTLQLPVGAKILTVREQGDVPCLWALVDPSAGLETRTILIHGTGHEVADAGAVYLGTYQLYGGQLVFHVFEVR